MYTIKIAKLSKKSGGVMIKSVMMMTFFIAAWWPSAIHCNSLVGNGFDLVGLWWGIFFLPVPDSTDGLAEQIDVSLYIELHSTALRRHLPSLMEEMSSASQVYWTTAVVLLTSCWNEATPMLPGQVTCHIYNQLLTWVVFHKFPSPAIWHAINCDEPQPVDPWWSCQQNQGKLLVPLILSNRR